MLIFVLIKKAYIIISVQIDEHKQISKAIIIFAALMFYSEDIRFRFSGTSFINNFIHSTFRKRNAKEYAIRCLGS